MVDTADCLRRYRPETKQEKKARLDAVAKTTAEEKEAQAKDSKKPLFVKYGLNHCAALIEAKKPSLLVVFLPALCRKMGVPYVIVKGKARLGTVVHKKTAAVLTIQDVKSEDQRELPTLISAAKANLYWGGGVRGAKSTQMLRKCAKAAGQTLSVANASKL
ncbi:50S ribosomal protein L30e-like protein [Daedaleopsis nitida]|nr:50S ribosomal protein L30e-like protein [Daedaleopsis nitida]